MLHHCERVEELNHFEVEILKEHIRKNQWYLGEKEDHEIDWAEAEMDFVLNYIQEVAREMRHEFCVHCPLSGDCEVKIKFDKKDGFTD